MPDRTVIPLLKPVSLTAALFVFFYLYGVNHFYRDPGSIFYNPSRAFERSYSVHREAEAIAFRNGTFTNGPTAAPIWKTGTSPTICAAIVTISRDTGNQDAPHPLELTITSALAGLTKLEREDLDLRVYFANTNPSEHPLWKTPLIDLVDKSVTAKNTVSPLQFNELRELEASKSFVTKASLDFSYALEDCHRSSSSPYIAIFEGDILVADGWFARTRVALRDIVRREKDEWLDLRLFNQERSLGWASNKLLGNNVPYIAFGLSATFLCLSLLFRRYLRVQGLSTSTVLFICCIFIPLLTMTFFQAGKSSMVPPLSGVSVQSWGCCTQGIVIQRDQVPALIEELRGKATSKPADVTIIHYAQANNLKRYVLNPVQVQHLGQYMIYTRSMK